MPILLSKPLKTNELRHDLCYLDPLTPSPAALSSAQADLFHYWLAQQYPFMVTRQNRAIVPGNIQVALVYFSPQRGGKIRAAYVIDRSSILRRCFLPHLSDIFPALNYPGINVYGSYAWQYITEELYVQGSSDLDLLVDYQDQSLAFLAALYDGLQQQLLPKLDGEIRFPGVGECAWKELLQDSDTILFKSIQQVDLLKRETLYAMFPTLLY